KSDLSPYKGQTRATVGTVVKNTDVAVEYLRNSRKSGVLADSVQGDTASLIVQKKAGPGMAGFSYGRDLDRKENVYSANYNVKFGGKKQNPHSDMFAEIREKQQKK